MRPACAAWTIVLASCASVATDVAVERDVCCSVDVPVATFAIDATALPGFLRPYFSEELAAVLHAKGLTEGDPADVVITLRYEAEDLEGAGAVSVATDPGEQVLTPRPEERDSFDGSLGVERAQRFMARVVVEMRTRAGDVVWSGVLSRPHRVIAGEYMHERARAAIHIAFQRLLEGFPPPQ